MNVFDQLAKAGARVTYFCAYCGYEFEELPKLPAKCPQCGKKLADFSRPVVEPAKLRTALQKR